VLSVQLATDEASVAVLPHLDTAAEVVAPVASPLIEATPAWSDAGWSDQSTMPTVTGEASQVAVLAPSMPWSARHPVARRRFFPVLCAVLAVVVIVTGAFAAVAVNDLNQNRSDLHSTQGQLADTQGQLTDTKSQLANTSNQLRAAQSQVTTLQAQVQQETSCIAALTASAAELSGIFTLEQTNFNAMATGSAWATALSAWQNAEIAANTDYYNAYAAAYAGQFTTANSWVSKGNAQVAAANAAGTKMTSAVKSIDATTTKIESELTTFNTHLASTEATCGFTPTTTG
jgi:peptidoglycan hydrolase CwlO-like protein